MLAVRSSSSLAKEALEELRKSIPRPYRTQWPLLKPRDFAHTGRVMSDPGWRAMDAADLAAVVEISDAVHGRFTEPAAVYRERLACYPHGCFVLERDGAVVGYLVSHPWTRGSSPELGRPIGAIPPAADTYYLHDIALLPSARGTGAGRSALTLVERCARAGGFGDITLTAVGGADRYWATQGFAYDREGHAAAYGAGTHRMRKILPPEDQGRPGA